GLALAFAGCHNNKTTEGGGSGADTVKVAPAPSFTLTVTEDASFTNLKPLMSFVFGKLGNEWLMFSGRKNGFHGFGRTQNFPRKKANDSIYVYDAASKKLYGMPIPIYKGDTSFVFLSTNLQHTQQGMYLFACGGYGAKPGTTDTVASKTYSYFMRINLEEAIKAVKGYVSAAGSKTAERIWLQNFKNAIKWGKSRYACATGGELFLLPDGNFYCAVGHKFTGTYDATTVKPATQIYVDSVNVFSVQEKNGALDITYIRSITDGLPDSTTQFRRRDLVVAPSIQANGTDVGLAIYGGVFTYTPGGIQQNGIPFSHPIYIDYKNTAAPYVLDTSNQWTNIYSAAFMSMYDGASKNMMTTTFGGLGDTKTNFASANWTSVISTNMRSFASGGDTGVTTYVQNPNALPGYLGTEAVFIPASDVPMYNSNHYKIIDYSKVTNGQTIGYIYGGIHSDSPAPQSASTGTRASSVVYKVVINK
ncbi:MAG: hypothetical protein ACHQII_06760, partial [Bacteroidia bacterium]